MGNTEHSEAEIAQPKLSLFGGSKEQDPPYVRTPGDYADPSDVSPTRWTYVGRVLFFRPGEPGQLLAVLFLSISCFSFLEPVDAVSHVAQMRLELSEPLLLFLEPLQLCLT